MCYRNDENMKIIEQRLPQDYDKSFIVFQERGQFFPYQWHYHPEYELVLVTQSTGRRMVGDHIGRFDKGDLVLMGPCLPHVWVNDTAYINGVARQMANAIVIQFESDFLGENFLKIPEMEPVRQVLRLSNQGLHIRGDASDRIAPLMEQMLTMNGIQRLANLFRIFDILVQTSGYEVLSSPGYVQRTSMDYSNRINRVTEYIVNNFDREITLKEIASVANMAVTTFCNFFKEHYRMTFVEYMNTVRIGYACKLLAESSLNIMEVAYRSGFNNLGNFNKRFRAIKRMTPKEYRKLIEVAPETALAI